RPRRRPSQTGPHRPPADPRGRRDRDRGERLRRAGRGQGIWTWSRGDGTTVAADGTQVETYIDNLLAETSIRYGGVGGIACHYAADTYDDLRCGPAPASRVNRLGRLNTAEAAVPRRHSSSSGAREAARARPQARGPSPRRRPR